jgi:hypothetical protein
MPVSFTFNKVNLNSVHFQSIPSSCCISFPGQIINVAAVYNILGFTVIPDISTWYFMDCDRVGA